LEQSSDLARSLGDTLSLEYANRLYDLAESLIGQGADFDKAEKSLNESLSVQAKLNPSPNILTGQTLQVLSTLKHFSGDFKSSEGLLRKSIEQFNNEGIAHPDAASSMRELAKILHVKRMHEEADSLFQASIAMYKELYGDAHPNMAQTIHNYGTSLVSQRKLEKAKEVQLQALEMFKGFYGEDYYLVGHVYRSLGDINKYEEDFDAAEKNYLKAVDLMRKTAPDQPAIATFIIDLGLIYQLAGRYSESEERFLEGISLRREKFGNEHALVLPPLLQLASTYEKWGNDQEAERRLRESLRMARSIYKSDSPRLGNIYLSLAALLERKNRHEESKALINNATDILGQEKVERFLKGERVVSKTH